MTFGMVQLMPMLSLYDNSKDFHYVLVMVILYLLVIVMHNLIATYYLFK